MNKKHVHYFSKAMFLFVLLCLGGQLMALNPKDDCQLLDHLAEVNQQWLKQKDLNLDLISFTAFDNDDLRIQAHLKLVAQTLRHRTVDHLSTEQQAKRTAMLDVLEQYWKRNLFPRNHYHSVRQPYFVDNNGTACAVGYLVLESGESALVERIKEENNYGYIAELSQVYPELTSWADAYGFTLDELAWIQPAYPPQPKPYQALGNGGGVEGTVNTVITDDNDDMLFLAGDFTNVDGVNANSVIAWNGEEWLNLGNGVEGEILALEYYDDKLFIAGDFALTDAPEYTNIAYWDGSNWTGLQEGDMEGSVYAIKEYKNRIYLGGDFQKVNGNERPYLAYYNYNSSQTWENSVRIYVDGQFLDVDGAFSVDAPVRCFEIVTDNLLVGGDFTLTAPEFPYDQVDQLETNYLAYWRGDNWVGALHGNHAEVHTVKYLNGDLYVGGDVSEPGGLSILHAGLWLENGEYFYVNAHGDNLVHDFIEYEESVLMIGGFSFDPGGVGIFGNGAAIFGTEWYDGNEYFVSSGYSVFNNTVKASTHFQGKQVFVGDFDVVDLIPIKNLAVLDASTNVRRPRLTEGAVKVFMSNDFLTIQYKELSADAQFRLFNLNGQLLTEFRLAQGSAALQKSLAQLPRGAYVYQVFGESVSQSGKLIR
jgi:hypothetical protein